MKPRNRYSFFARHDWLVFDEVVIYDNCVFVRRLSKHEGVLFEEEKYARLIQDQVRIFF
eukprot:SAG11_NODE_35102_length_268_cov_0.917160_1_plen_58_part_10